MKYLYILITLSLFGCWFGDLDVYTATVKNQSGVTIKVIGYYNGDSQLTTDIENEEEITKIFKTDRREFDPRYFFTSTVKDGEVHRSSFTDSIKVIYNNNEKYRISKYSFVQEKDSIGYYIGTGYTSGSTFVFTKEGYENGIDCNGACE